MKPRPLAYLGIVFGVLAIVDVVWLWSLPGSMPTTSVEHRRAYFLLSIALGFMFLMQGLELMNQEIRSRHMAGKIALGFGTLCVLAGLRIAYVHMSGN